MLTAIPIGVAQTFSRSSYESSLSSSDSHRRRSYGSRLALMRSRSGRRRTKGGIFESHTVS